MQIWLTSLLYIQGTTELHCIKSIFFFKLEHRNSFLWAGVFVSKNRKSTKKQNKTKKLASIVLLSFKGLVFLTFFLLLFFFFCFYELPPRVFLNMVFFFFFFCFFCKSKTAVPSGGSQVDIADICRGGGLIQLINALPARAPLCLLVLLLLLPALAQTA